MQNSESIRKKKFSYKLLQEEQSLTNRQKDMAERVLELRDATSRTKDAQSARLLSLVLVGTQNSFVLSYSGNSVFLHCVKRASKEPSKDRNQSLGYTSHNDR